MTVKKQQQSAKPSQDNSWYERSELPPVGCECEAFDSNENKWMRVEVIAIREGYVMMWCRECLRGFQSDDKSRFRPLRTEREKAIDSLIEIICAGGELSKDGSAAREIAERIHDAGVLK